MYTHTQTSTYTPKKHTHHTNTHTHHPHTHTLENCPNMLYSFMSAWIVVITYTLVSAKPSPEKENVEVTSIVLDPQGTLGSTGAMATRV